MTARALLLVLLAALALAVPAASLADGAPSGHQGALTRANVRAAAGVRFAHRLQLRYEAFFSRRCLVQSAPDRCAKAAGVLVRRLDALQQRLHTLEDAIKTSCAAPTPPPRCANAGRVTQRIDDALAKLASAESEIKARYPDAGGA